MQSENGRRPVSDDQFDKQFGGLLIFRAGKLRVKMRLWRIFCKRWTSSIFSIRIRFRIYAVDIVIIFHLFISVSSWYI